MRYYRDILGRSWKLLWKVPYLWFLGLFGLLLSGPGGDYGMLSSSTFQAFVNPKNLLDLLRAIFQADAQTVVLNRINEVVQTYPFQVFLLLAVFFAMSILLAVLTVLAQAGLVRGIGQALRGQRETLAKTIEGAWPTLGRVFGVIIGGFILLNVLVLLLSLPFWSSYIVHPTQAALIYAELVVLLVFLPVFFAVSFLSKYAVAFIVLGGYTLRSAVKAAWDLFRRNWLITLEMAILLAVLNVAIFYLAIAVPRPLYESNTMLGALLYFVLIVFIGALFAVFQNAVWILLYQELRANRGVSKVERMITGATISPRPLPRRT
jgi:hypothetical protein